jgi:menaquinone-dependent protoporphyrinogen oxidase
MTTRVLVTYATRAGSTGDVAQVIGEVLRARGFRADVRTIKSRPRVEDYGAVLIGSAVRSGSWLPEAVAFVAENQMALKHVPVALFTVHMHNTGSDPQSVANRRGYLSQIRPLIYPVGEAYFAGAIDPAKLPVLDRLMVRAVKAPVADQRDWNKIRSWAESVLAVPTP